MIGPISNRQLIKRPRAERITPVVHSVFEPASKWQEDAWKDTSSVVLLSGSAGSGKSRLTGEKFHAMAMAFPGSSFLFARKTYSTLQGTMLLPFEQDVIGEDLLGNDPMVRRIRNDSCYYYKNGSMIFYGGMGNEKERQKIRGIGKHGGLDGAWLDEGNAFHEEDLEELFPRLRGKATPFKQIVITTNPDSPEHWIYKRLVLKKEASCYFSSWKDNFHLNLKEYEEMLNKLTGPRLLRMRDGKWVQADGVVFEFDPDVHVLNGFDLPHNWPRFCSIDFGYNVPFVCQWWAIDPNSYSMYLYREIYQTQLLVEDAARLIKQLSGQERIEAYVTDHDSEDRATLGKYGIHTILADKEVIPGIQAVQAKMRVGANGKPQLFVLSDALWQADQNLINKKHPYCTMQEFAGYVYDKYTDGRSKEEPKKLHDHGMDAMRYAAMYVDQTYTRGYTSKDRPGREKLANDFSKMFAAQKPRGFY